MESLHADVLAALEEAAAMGNSTCAKVLKEHSGNVPATKQVATNKLAAANKSAAGSKPAAASKQGAGKPVAEDATMDSPAALLLEPESDLDRSVSSPGVLLLEPEPTEVADEVAKEVAEQEAADVELEGRLAALEAGTDPTTNSSPVGSALMGKKMALQARQAAMAGRA